MQLLEILKANHTQSRHWPSQYRNTSMIPIWYSGINLWSLRNFAHDTTALCCRALCKKLWRSDGQQRNKRQAFFCPRICVKIDHELVLTIYWTFTLGSSPLLVRNSTHTHAHTTVWHTRSTPLVKLIVSIISISKPIKLVNIVIQSVPCSGAIRMIRLGSQIGAAHSARV